MTNHLKHGFPLVLDLQTFAEGEPTPDIPNNPEDKGDGDPEDKKPDTVTMTQSELDAKFAERAKRAEEKVHKQYADYEEKVKRLAELEKAEEERRKAAMSEQERLEAEKAEALKKAEEAEGKSMEALKRANDRLIKAEFRLAARDAGIRPDALDDAFVLSDRSVVEVDEDGNVKGVKEAINALRESKMYLFGNSDYADPSPGNNAPNRVAQESLKKRIQDAEDRARKTGRQEDRIEAMTLRAQLENN